MSAFAAVMAPKAWYKYVQLVTGVVILISITSPVIKPTNSDFTFEMPSNYVNTEDNEELNKNLIINELSRRIEEDIENRVKRDYNSHINAQVKILVNDKEEIEGVEEIRITEGELGEIAKQKLCEIYGVDMIYER